MDHRKHARYVWTCPICFRVIVGNGGKSSHKIAHVRRGDAHLPQPSPSPLIATDPR